MTRLVAGSAGGRRLRVPAGGRTRPTAERAREGLFSTLGTLLGPLDGRAFADFYAGSGAVGLEAASRGASRTLLVEADPAAFAVLRANAAALALPGVQPLQADVDRVLAGPPPAGPFDVAFADPPYAAEVATLLERLAGSAWLRPGGLVILERATRSGAPAWPAGLVEVRSRRYGEATLWYGRRS